jgi:hypothetical protein
MLTKINQNIFGEMYMKFRKLFWMITILMTLVLVACSGEAVAPTADGSGSASSTLSQNVTFEGGILGGGFSVAFPDGWSHHINQDGIELSNNADIINTTDESKIFPTGTIAMSISLIPPEDSLGITNVTTLLKAFVDVTQRNPNPPTYGEIEAITISNWNGAKTFGTLSGSDNMLFMVDVGDSYIFAAILTPGGELDSHMDAINAIVGSVELSPAE